MFPTSHLLTRTDRPSGASLTARVVFFSRPNNGMQTANKHPSSVKSPSSNKKTRGLFRSLTLSGCE